jgi:hypothetical protein
MRAVDHLVTLENHSKVATLDLELGAMAQQVKSLEDTLEIDSPLDAINSSDSSICEVFALTGAPTIPTGIQL